MVVKRFDVYLVNRDPTVGSEIKKTRPCLVVSPDEMNRWIRTAPSCRCRGRKSPVDTVTTGEWIRNEDQASAKTTSKTTGTRT